MLRRTGLGFLLIAIVACDPAPPSKTASTPATPTLAPPATVEPVTEPPVVATESQPVATIVQTASVALTAMVAKTANVRDKPAATGSTVLGQVEGGTLVKLRMRNGDSSWYVVEAPSGLIGWMSAALLSVDPAVASQVAEGTDDPAIAQQAPAAPASTDGPATDVAAPAPAEAPAAASSSGRVAPQGKACPNDHQIKGNINKAGKHLYHLPGEGSYSRTNPEACFATRADADAAGYTYSPK